MREHPGHEAPVRPGDALPGIEELPTRRIEAVPGRRGSDVWRGIVVLSGIAVIVAFGVVGQHGSGVVGTAEAASLMPMASVAPSVRMDPTSAPVAATAAPAANPPLVPLRCVDLAADDCRRAAIAAAAALIPGHPPIAQAVASSSLVCVNPTDCSLERLAQGRPLATVAFEFVRDRWHPVAVNVVQPQTPPGATGPPSPLAWMIAWQPGVRTFGT